jgi:hypothetical protein
MRRTLTGLMILSLSCAAVACNRNATSPDLAQNPDTGAYEDNDLNRQAPENTGDVRERSRVDTSFDIDPDRQPGNDVNTMPPASPTPNVNTTTTTTDTTGTPGTTGTSGGTTDTSGTTGTGTMNNTTGTTTNNSGM